MVMLKPGDGQNILPLKVNNATVRKRGKTILRDISLTLGTTGITIVMGPNGSGKSTFLRLLHGLERPRGGTVDWHLPNDIARTRQTFVFQTPILMRRSVLSNIAYPLRLQGISNHQARAEAKQWLHKIGLDGHEDMEAQFLSGGEQQKMALARALITNPDVVFLDEPTSNLGGKSIREIEAILQTAHRAGLRIVMTTHDLGQAKRLADDVIFLNNGRICEHSAAEAFFTKPQSKPGQAYLKGDIVE